MKGRRAPCLIASLSLGLLWLVTGCDTINRSEDLSALPFSTPGSDRNPKFTSNEILIRVTALANLDLREGDPADTGIGSVNELNKRHGVKGFEKIARPGTQSRADAALFRWYKVTLRGPRGVVKGGGNSPEERLLKEVAADFRRDRNIELAEPNQIVELIATPNDPYYASTGSWGQTYPDLWGIKKINAEAAWDTTLGSDSIVVADVDTGVDRNHPDLTANMWVNDKEIPGNGIDDDGNGFIDDYNGWDFANNDKDPMDDHGHGTHTVGTIAGVGNNNLGVVGVNWKAKIMAIKFLNSSGSGTLDNAVKALHYAADMGARVASNSWGSSAVSQITVDAVRYAHQKGVAVIVAAGNSNSDAIFFSPACADDAITVAASDPSDLKASFSNWGEKIDVAAPGVDILSTRASVNPMCTAARTVGTNYCRVSGTSMATPHVAGLAALLLSKNPLLTNEELRQIIRASADDLGTGGKDSSFGYGRINAGKAVALAGTHPLTPYISSPISHAVVQGESLQISGSVAGPGFASYKIETGTGTAPTSWTTLLTSTTQPAAEGTLASISTSKLVEGSQILRLSAETTTGQTFIFQVNNVVVDNFDIAVTSPSSLVSKGAIQIKGTVVAKGGLALSSYKVEWGSGTDPASFSTAGIVLANGGTQPVTNGLLATWDTTSLTPGPFTLRVTAAAAGGQSARQSLKTQLDQDLAPGWPKAISRDGCPTTSSCLVTASFADLDGDGKKEIIVPAPASKVYALRADGSDLPGFPALVTAGDRFAWPANIADLDGDGKKEIIASAITSASKTRIYILRSDGTPLPGWSPPLLGSSSTNTTPAAVDLDADGKKELVFFDGQLLHAMKLNGVDMAGFPAQITAAAGSGAALSVIDLDKDGQPEFAFNAGGKAYLCDSSGKVLPGWPITAAAQGGVSCFGFLSAQAAGDLDGDGQLELVALATASCAWGYSGYLYAWNKSGAALTGWPKQGPAIYESYRELMTPTLTDLDGDGKDEILVPGLQMQIFGVDGVKPGSMAGTFQPALADVDGDGKAEIADFNVYWNWGSSSLEVRNHDATPYWSRQLVSFGYYFSPMVVADIDGNGKVELASVEGRRSGDGGDLSLYLWSLPQSVANPNDEWPLYLHDAARSGRRTSASGPADTQPPTAPTNLAGVALSANLVNLSWNASTDNVGVKGYKILRDGAVVSTVGNVTTASDATVVGNHSYTYQVAAFDAAGNTSALSNSVVVTTPTAPDSEPPTAPTNLSGVAVSSTQVNLTWTASTDNVGVTGYKLFRDGVAIATLGKVTTTSDTTVSGGKTYAYTVAAFDAAGNQSAPSNQAVVTTPAPPDTQPPTAPTNLSATAVSSTQVNLSWSAATDNVGIKGYKVYRDGTLLTTLGNVTSTSDTTVTGGKTYSYAVSALDTSNNESPLSSPATVTTPAPPDSQPPTVPANLTGTPLSSTQVKLSWSASSDNVGVTGYKVMRDGAPLITLGAVTTFTDSSVVGNHSYSYSIAAFDAAGNTSAFCSPVSVVTPAPPDVTPPTAPTSLTATAISATRIDLSWKPSTDNIGVMGYKLYRGSVIIASVGSSILSYSDTTVVPATTYTYRVAAFDAAGNTSALSNAATATTPSIDTQPPTAPTGLTAKATGRTAQLSWNASTDNIGVTAYQIFRDGALLAEIGPATSYSDSTSLGRTLYYYHVVALDKAGNASPPSAEVSVRTKGAPPK